MVITSRAPVAHDPEIAFFTSRGIGVAEVNCGGSSGRGREGLEDEICPPVPCERFVEGIAGRGVTHAYLTFEGEQHGFRRKETIVAALRAELSLYSPGLRLHTGR